MICDPLKKLVVWAEVLNGLICLDPAKGNGAQILAPKEITFIQNKYTT